MRNRDTDYFDKYDISDEDRAYELDRRIHNLTVAGFIELVICLILLGIYHVLMVYTVRNVYVEGNAHYSAAEIRKFVETGWFYDNSFFLSLKYRNKSITDIPFVEKMDVDVVDKNTIKITVYEKTLAGYVEYLGTYVYFDKDGIVVESSKVKTDSIPLVTGLKFDHFVTYEPLPVDDPGVFQIVLNVTQLLGKYGIVCDRIYFNDNGDMTLYFGDIRVKMGDTDLLEEKVQRLDAILPQLDDMKGMLDMSSYDEGKENFTFTKD